MHRSRTGERVLRRGVLLAMAVVVAMAAAAPDVLAQSQRALVDEGNRLYEEGRYAEAHRLYLEAMAADPDSPVIPFNDGNALYQDADYTRAMEAYRQAIETGDASLAADAWYNLGNALYRQQELEPSLEAYKEALRRRPNDPDAKHNLERVLERMQQQQQRQQQQDDQEQHDEEEPEGQEGEGQDRPQEQPQGGDQPEGDEGEQEEEPDQGGTDEPQDEGEEPPQESQGDRPPEDGEGEGRANPAEAGMTEEEAQRLLDAIDEDPGDVNRTPPPASGRRPRKPW